MNLKFWHRSSLSRLGKDKRTSGPGLLARLLRDEEGSYLIYGFAIFPVLIGVGGLAGEGGLLLYNHRALQSAADAAAYSAAIAYSYNYNSTDPSNPPMTNAELTAAAQPIVASYGFDLGPGDNQADVAAIKTTFSGLPAVQVTASRPQSAIFSKLALPVLTLPNNVSATAVISGGGGLGNCLLALGNTATGNNAADAIQIQGGGGKAININVPDCGVFSDSTSSTSMAFAGSATMTAGSVGAAGSIVGGSDITLPAGTTATQNDAPISDPYKGTALPNTPAPPCINPTYPDTRTTTKLPDGNYPMALTSGRYCSLTTAPTGPHLGTYDITLAAGVYIFDSQVTNESTVVVQNGSLTGTDVTLVFTSSNGNYPKISSPATPMLEVASNGVVSLTAPTTGATAGFVMMGDPAMPIGTIFDTQSNPNVSVSGTIWVPNGAFHWNGTPVSGSTECVQYVVNTITLYGNSALRAVSV
jgi:Flp pilus assembly protein TadG